MNQASQGRGSQFAREARIGLTIIAVLVIVFVWFTYRRFSSSGESIADLRSEASQRNVSVPDQSAGTPDNPYGRSEITNRGPRNIPATPVPTAGPKSQTFADNPARSNPANDQSPPRVASSFHNSGKPRTGKSNTSQPKVMGGGNDIKPQSTKSQNRKPEQTKKSSDDALMEPVIELGQEVSLEELDSPAPASQFSANLPPPFNASNPIVITEPPIAAVQPDKTPNNFATIPNSAEADRGQPFTQLPAARNANTTGIRAEMISTTQNKTQTFFVEKNDTYWSISQRAYGTGHYYKALYEYNKGHVRDPDNLPVGQKIVAPPIDTLKSKFPHLIKEKGSVNQTSYEQSESAPPFQPQLADETQLPQDLLLTHDDDSNPELPDASNKESIPQFDARPDLLQSKQFIPRNGPEAGPAAADGSPKTGSSRVVIPSADVPTQSERTLNDTAIIYAVREGENLFDIARNELLQASRYLEILELNREHLPEDCTHLTPLPAGLKLRLPEQ